VTEASGKVKNRDLGGTIVSIWGYLRPVWCTIISGGCGGCAVVMMYVCVYYTTKNLPMSVARVTQGKGQRSSAADVCNILVACIEMLPRICLRNKHLLTRSPNPPPRHRPLTTTALDAAVRPVPALVQTAALPPRSSQYLIAGQFRQLRRHHIILQEPATGDFMACEGEDTDFAGDD